MSHEVSQRNRTPSTPVVSSSRHAGRDPVAARAAGLDVHGRVHALPCSSTNPRACHAGILPELKERAVILLQNFPDTFNKHAVLTIELGVGNQLKVEQLQDRITTVMSTVYDDAPELGGKHAEHQTLAHVLLLQAPHSARVALVQPP